MILVVAAGVAVLVALLRGGRLARLADLDIRYAWLALAAVALQYPLVYNVVGGAAIGGVPLALPLLGASWLLVAVVVWANRRLPGALLVGLGMACNLLVMALNGGWMPISPGAMARLGRLSWVETAGLAGKIPGSKNAMLTRAETRLWWLSDVFVIAPPLPRAAFSIGDLLVAVGVFWLIQYALARREDGARRT